MQDPTYVQLVESQSTAATGTAPSILVMGEPQLNSAPIVPDINLNEWEAQPLDSGYSPQIGGELPTMQILIPEGFVPPDQQHLSADEMIAHRMMAGEENVVSETRMACLERWDAEWPAANPEGRGGNRLLEALNDCPEEPAGGVPWAAIGLGLLFLL